jgi:hypothetical protein
MRKDDALRIVTSCAKQYRDNLENKNLKFVFSNNGAEEYFESLFLPRHFLHLTGVQLLAQHMKSSDYYNLCLKGNLPLSAFNLYPNGTTEMKLSVLPQIMNIHKTAKMIGDYNDSKSLLVTEKIVGTITACLGFQKDGNYYVPNTVLREDIRDVTATPQKRILAILRKDIKAKSYTECTYAAKGYSLSETSQ